MRTKSRTLTEQELEIMKVVWELPTATVRDVYEALLRRRKIAYTTVMTMMNILEEKGYLKKQAGEKAHVYRPAQAKARSSGRWCRSLLSVSSTAPPNPSWCIW
jgi:predicted transcriptional regulator